jgi:hypothetical protein
MMKRKQYVSVNRYCIRICNNNVEIYHNSILLSIGKLLGCRLYSVDKCKKPHPCRDEASRSYSVLFAIFPRLKCYFCFSSSSRSSQSSCDQSSQSLNSQSSSSASRQASSQRVALSSQTSSHHSFPSHASKHSS